TPLAGRQPRCAARVDSSTCSTVAARKESRMKRHALFFATALALASLGTAGLAAAQSTPVAKAADARSGHGMRGGIERMDADGDGRISRAEFDAARAAREEAIAARIARRTADGGRALDADGKA